MDLAAAQLLRSLRGTRSQVAWARRLGYRGNPITDWERARNFPTAEETLRVAARAGIDVEAAFGQFDPKVPLHRQTTDTFELADWLRRSCATKRVTSLALEMDAARSSVSRWLAGKAKPRLPEFLALVQAATGRVHDLVAALVPIETVPSLLAQYQASNAAKRLAFDVPWTEAILRVLETSRGRASGSESTEDWVARVLQLPASECKTALDYLQRAGLIVWDNGGYVTRQTLSVDTRGGKQAVRALKVHWAKVAMQRAANPMPDDVFGYNVISVSEADLVRIRELLATSYRQIRAIVASSEPAERVALVNLQLVAWSNG